MTQSMNKELILQMGADKMIPRQTSMVRLPDRSELKNSFQSDMKG
jgi:hypothetical protein